MLKKILAGVAIVIAVLLIVIATRPAQFEVVRSAHISASPAIVFPLIDDFHAWTTWSPWEKLDPNLNRQYSGAQRGTGAEYAWSGNDQVGSGSMTITESRAPEQVVIRLEFKEPFEATNVTTFTLKPESAGSEVSWSMAGDNNFVGKAMSLFMDMDQMIGKDFERGLGNLKAIAETRASSATAAAPASP